MNKTGTILIAAIESATEGSPDLDRHLREWFVREIGLDHRDFGGDAHIRGYSQHETEFTQYIEGAMNFAGTVLSGGSQPAVNPRWLFPKWRLFSDWELGVHSKPRAVTTIVTGPGGIACQYTGRCEGKDAVPRSICTAAFRAIIGEHNGLPGGI